VKFRKICSVNSAYSAEVAECEGSRWADYQARLDRVIDYIHDHLDEHLDLNRLAEVACLSPYHWHRIYHGMLGETVVATIRRLRLHRAAGDLVRSNAPIRDIAAACGFNSVQSFSRVFRAAFGTTPGQYRSCGIPVAFTSERKHHPSSMYEVTLRNIPKMKALTCKHTGSYLQIGRAFDHLCGWLVAHNAFPPDMRLIAVYYDDPAAKPEEELRSCAGIVLPDDKTIESPFDQTEIGGGPYAVMRHTGPYGELSRAYQWLYGQWLPQSGQEAADAPVFEEYLNTPRDTAPTDLVTDICLPLR
jgi:AraC family transcriptional regulator